MAHLTKRQREVVKAMQAGYRLWHEEDADYAWITGPPGKPIIVQWRTLEALQEGGYIEEVMAWTPDYDYELTDKGKDVR